MGQFCLLPETITKFKQALKDGKIEPNKLAEMSSVERNEFLGDIVGKNHAKAVNSLFESKILLKNQQQGYLNWAKTVSGIKPETRRDLIKRIENMQKVLDPDESKQFMKDLTATRLGINVTEAEAKQIATLSKKVSEFEFLKGVANKEERMKYGYAVEDLTDYVASLKQNAEKIRPTDLIKNPGLIGKFTSKVAGNMKSLQASLDNSAVFRQGLKVMWTEPKIWAKNSADTFRTIARTMGGKNVLREVNADIISRPNYDLYTKAKLAIKNPEEAFPESLAEKVPYLRRLYKASEAAFTAFQYKNRVDVFDKYISIAKKQGVDISDKTQLESIGKLVNSLTGRGYLGAAEPVAGVVNNVFFSPRFLKSNWDTLTAHQLQKDVTPFVRKKAATNLAKIIGGTATVLATANALMPGSVELDPRSSDFGKIKIKDTRFDIAGGMSSIITLAARMLTQSSKSATTGKVTSLNSDEFGSRTAQDVFVDFFANKLSPAAQTVKHLYEGEDFSGNKTDILKETVRSVTPIGVQNAQELLTNPNAANTLFAIIADGLGIGTNTYGATKDSWQQSSSKELKAFKDKVGEEKFNKAAETFDNSFNAWMDKVMDDPKYQNMSTDEKTSLMSKKKEIIKKDIFTLNGFEYKTEKKPEVDNSSLLK